VLVDLLQAAGVHVAAEEERTGYAGGSLGSCDEGDACAVAPTHQRCSFDVERVHDFEDIGCHKLVGVGASVACAVAVSAAVDENDAMACVDEIGDLITPVAAVAEAAVEEDYGQAEAIGGEPDEGTFIFNVALIVGSW